MSQHNADRHVQSDGAVPYCRLWSACFLGFGADWHDDPGHAGLCARAVRSECNHRRPGGDDRVSGHHDLPPVSGRFADQSGGRRVAMAGAILALIGGIGHVVATNLPILILARLFLGAGEGALSPVPSAGSWPTQSNRSAARSQGILACRCGWDWRRAPMLATAILAIGNYRNVWIATAIIPMLAWMLVASTRPEPRVLYGDTNIRRALFPRAAWVPGASGAFASIGYGIIAAFLVPRFAALDFAAKTSRSTVFGIAFMITRFLAADMLIVSAGGGVLLSAFLIESSGACRLITHPCGVARFRVDSINRRGTFPADSERNEPCNGSCGSARTYRSLGRRDVRMGFGRRCRRPIGRACCRRLERRAVRARRCRRADRDNASGDKSQT